MRLMESCGISQLPIPIDSWGALGEREQCLLAMLRRADDLAVDTLALPEIAEFYA